MVNKTYRFEAVEKYKFKVFMPDMLISIVGIVGIILLSVS